MSIDTPRDIGAEIISMLKRYSGTKEIELDKMIGRDIGINGSDGIQILFEIEDSFGVDLNPLIDAHVLPTPSNWFDWLLGRSHGVPRADLTVRELIDYVAAKRRCAGE